MPFPDDLLEQAKHLANREKKKPRQASLRRSVSTAYYALFHLLIQEATLNWRRPDQRALLARFFEHGKMKAASEKQRSDCNRDLNQEPSPLSRRELDSTRHLHRVANAFSQAYQQRMTADYNNAKQWSRSEVLSEIELVEKAFKSWREIRNQATAQRYLISLLGNPKGV
jgi:uncharacterized protein (UPF0332 family)